MADIRSMFSAMRKRQTEEDVGEQSKRTRVDEDEPAAGPSIEEDAPLHVEDIDSGEDDIDDPPPIPHEGRRKPPGPEDISQTPSVGPTQPDITFPLKQQDCKRSFQSSWYNSYPWLEYSEGRDAAFCFACRHFVQQTIHTEETFISAGFSNWKKARGKGGKLTKHNTADYHVNAMVHWSSFKESEKVGSVHERLSGEYSRLVQENRHFIKTVGEVLLITGTQNISQRGHREDEESGNAGNVRRILQLVSGHDEVVRKRLQEGPQNAKYTSPEIQNEMLQILAQMVRDEILQEVKESELFTILVDETKDIRKTEQLALVCRYFHDLKIKESFLSFKNAEGLDAKSLSDSIIALLSGYGLDFRRNLVGQGYDGASVMSGTVSGVAKRIKDVAPLATYVHCYAHRLNLVIVDVCKSVPGASQFFALLQELYVFVSGSYVHSKWIDVQRELHPDEQPRELKRLSDTRWACRADACEVMVARLQAVLHLLQQISEESHGERAVEARGLLAQLDRHFVARLVLMTALLKKTKTLSSLFQQEDVDLSEAGNLAAVITKELEDMRGKEEAISEIWEEVEGVISSCEEDLAPAPRPRRAPRPSRQLEGFHVMETSGQRQHTTPKEDFKVHFMFPILDRMLGELKRRFSDENQDLLRGIDALSPSSSNFLELDLLTALQQLHGSSHEDLKHEVHQLKRLIERKTQKGEVTPTSLQELLVYLEPYKDAFYELYHLTKVAAVMPVTSASCERSFSAMKLIKTYLRNSMGHSRLSDIGILSIERSRADRVDLEEFVDRFAAAHQNRRIQLV